MTRAPTIGPREDLARKPADPIAILDLLTAGMMAVEEVSQ